MTNKREVLSRVWASEIPRMLPVWAFGRWMMRLERWVVALWCMN